MIPMPHLSFVQCEQIKFRPKKNVKMKVSHSVVAVGIVAGGGGSAGRGGGIHVMLLSILGFIRNGKTKQIQEIA